MATVELLTTPQPHLVPGYAGYCPQYRYRCGETYGSVTHKLLVDPTINHANEMVLSNRTVDDYEVIKPKKNDIDIITSRIKRMDPTYKYPLVPGYQGFMPNLNARLGQRYAISAIEGLADFERQRLKDRAALNHLKNVIALQGGLAEPRTLAERQATKTEFKLPLITVRRDWARTMRNIPVQETCPPIKTFHYSPYFMENSDDRKHFVSGYTGHIPHRHAHFGETHRRVANSALCNFTNNYKSRQSTEWSPVNVSRPDPPYLIQPTEIYHKHVGMIPNYLGHIPGAAFRHGKTYGADTRDAKRWLRGDFSL